MAVLVEASQGTRVLGRHGVLHDEALPERGDDTRRRRRRLAGRDERGLRRQLRAVVGVRERRCRAVGVEQDPARVELAAGPPEAGGGRPGGGGPPRRGPPPPTAPPPPPRGAGAGGGTP